MEVRGLTRRYGKHVVVDSLDLTVQVGDVYGFLGPNGAGKTTAMRCILGLIRRDAGRVELLGQADITRARAQVGAIIETPTFHGWMSGRANLEQAALLSGLGAGTKPEIDRVLERVGLADRAKDRAANYSLGMRQRLGIARALLGRPKMLFLDEPTNGLDPSGMHEMRELIRSLALHDDITIFISSHLLAEVQAICNRVGILRDGKLRAEGTVAALIEEARGESIVEVGAADKAALEAALGAIEGITVAGAGTAGRVRVRYGELPLAQLNRRLLDAGVEVEALVPITRSLEDVFMEVVQ